MAIGYVALGWALTYLAVATPRAPARDAEVHPLPAARRRRAAGDLDASLSAFGTNAAISDFLGGERTVDAADDITTSGLQPVRLAARAARARSALALALVFVALNAMRVGLLTRFMGVLGIITGALQILPFGGPLPVVQCFWLVMLGAAVLRSLARRDAAGVADGRRRAVAELGAQLREQRARAAAERRGETYDEPEPEPERRRRPLARRRPRASASASGASRAPRRLLLLQPEPEPLGRVQREHLGVGRPARVGGRAARRADIVANASGTESTAGWVSSASSVPVVGVEQEPGEDRRRRRRRADHEPGRRAARGQPLPPDPEQQQRAERGRRQRERPADQHGDVELARDQREQRRHDHRAQRGDAEARAGAPAASRATPRRKSCDSVPASDTSSPDAVDMNAANAPAATSAPSSSPPSPGHAASGSRSTTVSVSPVRYSSGVSTRPSAP